MSTIREKREVSWKPNVNGPRLFGAFSGYTSDGKMRVRRGPHIHELDPHEITWEVG